MTCSRSIDHIIAITVLVVNQYQHRRWHYEVSLTLAQGMGERSDLNPVPRKGIPYNLPFI